VNCIIDVLVSKRIFVITLPCLGVDLFPPYVKLQSPLEFSAELFSSSVTQSPCMKQWKENDVD